jgi:hypothetical protein
MADPVMKELFPGFPTRPVGVKTLHQIEAVARKVIDLRRTMEATPPGFRWLATCMTSDDLADIYGYIYRDNREYEAQGIRELPVETTATPLNRQI